MRLGLVSGEKYTLACHECDLLVVIPALGNGKKACCPRCGFIFTRYFSHAKSKLLALSISSLIFMSLTLAFPFLIFTSQGHIESVSFIQSIFSMGTQDYWLVVLLMLLTTLVIPLTILVGINYVTLSSKRAKLFPLTKRILRGIFYLQSWNMAEIFLLGILVSMVKIASLAQVEFGWSFYSFVLYIVSMAATRLYFDRFQVWHWLARKDSHDIDVTNE
jgi:uncharacterized paraquat-inducible protein A